VYSFRSRREAVITTIIKSMNEGLPWLAPLLQVSDSAFPTGGYAHSAGFEQIVQLGLVRDAATMAAYIENHLWPALGHFELPVVRLAQAAAKSGDVSELIVLDEILDASKGARELREASRSLGRRRLSALRDIGASNLPAEFVRLVDENKTPGHHAVVFGAGLASMPEAALLSAWAFQTLNGICLASPKLLRIGQDAVQRVLAGALASVESRIETARSVARDDIGWFDPTLEIASMQHEIAHERLFIS
jgi:urease accessory protein